MDILRGIAGLFFLVALGYLFSADRKFINWKLVIAGIGLQLIIGILIFKVPVFGSFFNLISNGFVKFLGFGIDGAAFLFGDLARNSEGNPAVRHNLGFLFAFQALPIVVFFSAISSLLYYFGILQKVVFGLAWVLKKMMRLSGAESLSAAGNIFLGQTEAPLLVRPFISSMTKSELHCLMTGGMATIAGTVMGAYVGLLGGGSEVEQVKFATYLLGASLMSAPAAIVFAKLFYPEKHIEDVRDELAVSKDKMGTNVLDALANGATQGLKLALNIGAMLIAFIALIYMVNWLMVEGIGEITGLNQFVVESTGGVYQGFSLQYLLGQLFRTLAFAMGVEWGDTLHVGSLLGQKIVINEFVAYFSFSGMVAEGSLSPKSVIIATYALCGFANFGSIAIQIGGIGSMAPNRQADLSRLGLRALVAAFLASMMTATVAGMLY
ncbi:MAG: NupC/NupG family nucleoside CNT transporter [Cyclobacteriaceae bacterium]|nr:NupC/NupG family nucleoside CNT transporter [Cyclobacteriaceae bacterium]